MRNPRVQLAVLGALAVLLGSITGRVLRPTIAFGANNQRLSIKRWVRSSQIGTTETEQIRVTRKPDRSLIRFLDSTNATRAAATVPDVCAAFSGDLTAPSFCLRGDGTSTGSLSLSAVGSPTTQTMGWCGNGLSCASVSRQLLSGSNYFQTASMSQPPGSFWACARGINDAPMVLGRYIAQGSGWAIRVSAAGQLFFDVGGGTAVSSSTGAIVGGADMMPCVWWHQVASGSNVATLYLDGVQVAQNTTEPNISAVTTQINVGGNAPVSRIDFAMFGTGDPSSTLFARLAAATAPTPQGTRGEALTFSRNSLASCTAPDGSLTWLQPGRPCVSGGLRVRPQVTNLLTFSEQFDNVAWVNAISGTGVNPVVTANYAQAPDGSMTAERVQLDRGTGTSSFSSRRQTLGSSGSASIWLKTTSGGTAHISFANFCTGPSFNTITVTGTWQRFKNTTGTGTIPCLQLSVWSNPGDNDQTADILAWGAQLETGTIASDYCRSESTSATCGAETASVPMPTSASRFEGCSKVCITPNWTGANPSTANQMRFLTANAAATARLTYMQAGPQTTISAYDGTHVATASGGLAAGVKSCFTTRWSAGGNALTVTNLTTGITGTPLAFSGFPSFSAALQVGCDSSGNQPNAATISDIQLGSSSGACQ